MSYTISDLKQELTGALHGTTLNQVVGLDPLINRSARKLLEAFDPAETIRIVPLGSPIFDRIFDYPIPTDLKGDRVIDIRPQVNRTIRDRFLQTYNEIFDAEKYMLNDRPEFTVQHNTGIKSIRINKPQIQGLLVNAASSITDNGTWAVADAATNLTVDNINYVYGSGALRFDAGAGATVSLENSTMTAIDLTRDLLQGYEFLYVYLPTPANTVSCTLIWGSSNADYWTQTVTTTQQATAFQTGWNFLAFPWKTATVVGNPDPTLVNYVKFSINTLGAADTNYRLNDLTSQLGFLYEIEYYSKFIFRDGITGAFQETVTDGSNVINLDTDSYNVFFDQVAFYAAQQVQGVDSKFDVAFFKNELEESMKRYTAKIKSQVRMPTEYYYAQSRTKQGKLTRYSSS